MQIVANCQIYTSNVYFECKSFGIFLYHLVSSDPLLQIHGGNKGLVEAPDLLPSIYTSFLMHCEKLMDYRQDRRENSEPSRQKRKRKPLRAENLQGLDINFGKMLLVYPKRPPRF